MKNIITILKNEKGSLGHIYEMALVIVIIIWLSSIASPNFVSYITKGKNRKINRETQCFENMLAILKDNNITGRHCPLSEKPYNITQKGTVETLACPEKENHKWIKATFVKNKNIWDLKEKISAIELNEGDYAIEASQGKIGLTVQPDKIIINAESNFLIRYLISPLFFLGPWWCSVILFIMIAWLNLETILPIWLIFFWFLFFYMFTTYFCILFFYHDAAGIYSHKKIEVSRMDSTLTETNRIFLKQGKPEVIEDIRAILSGKGDQDILILYGREPMRCKRIFLRAAKSEAIVPRAVLSQAIFNSQ